ncbi:MAG: hypothetical protein ACK46Y_16335 [Fluviicola sp.]|jgi:hypothetical protein
MAGFFYFYKMRHPIIIVFCLFIFNNQLKAQSYFENIVKTHFDYIFKQDSIINNNGYTIKIDIDSLIVLNENKEFIKKYWHKDSTGKMINIYIEISNNSLFVIKDLEENNKEYSLYKKRGQKKVILYTWIDNGFEKRKEKLFKPNPKYIHYYSEGLVF